MSSEDKRFIGRLLEGVILYSVGVFLTYSLWRTYNSFWGVVAAGIVIIIVSGLVGVVDSRVLTSTGYRSGERFQIIGALFGSSYVAACLCVPLYLWATNAAPSIDIWFIHWPLFRIDGWLDGTFWQLAAILPPGLVILMAEFLRQDSFEAEQEMAVAYLKPKKSSASNPPFGEQRAASNRQPARLVPAVAPAAVPSYQPPPVVTPSPPRPVPVPVVQSAPLPPANHPPSPPPVPLSRPTPSVWDGEEPAWVIAYRAALRSEVASPQAVSVTPPVAALPQVRPVAAPSMQAPITPPPAVAPPAPVAPSMTQPVAPSPTPPIPASLPPATPMPLRLSADELAALRRAEASLDADNRAGLLVVRRYNGREMKTAQLKVELAALRPGIGKDALRKVFFNLKELGLAGNDGSRQVYWARTIPGLWEPAK